jgi:bacillithiol biosynthesis cysteine-adding enzyme BshC
MEIKSINRDDTFFSNDFIKDYYTDKFKDFRSYEPKIEEVARAIGAKKSFTLEKRKTLVSELYAQYQNAEIILDEDSLVAKNIASLKNANTYTITTGQQIHIGLGPLYVAYKTFETIAICKELKELYPENNFVPVFWMATEDHDLEEIRTISAYGKTFTWNTKQTGAVGRMNTNGLVEVFEEIASTLNLNSEQKQFIELCKEYYTHSNLSDSFRRLLHFYFKEEGLVILDGDSNNLKQSFVPVLMDEFKQENTEALQKTTQNLLALGVEQQIVIRDINLFTLRNANRLKIKKEGNSWVDESGSSLCNSADLESYITQEAAEISPNAALRPLYQEWILPNLVYVGGGAEVKYWLQLKGLFDNYEMPMPLVHLRSSSIIVQAKRLMKMQYETIADFFLADSEVISKYGNELKLLGDSFFERISRLESELNLFNKDFENAFSGASVTKKIDKIFPKIDELKQITQSQLKIKSQSNSNLDKIIKLKSSQFNESVIQERTDSVLAYIDIIGQLSSKTEKCSGFNKSQKINIIIS